VVLDAIFRYILPIPTIVPIEWVGDASIWLASVRFVSFCIVFGFRSAVSISDVLANHGRAKEAKNAALPTVYDGKQLGVQKA